MIDPSLLDVLLMEYAAGHLRPAQALLVACHVALRPAARRRVQAYEALGAKLVCDCKEDEIIPMTGDCFDKIMSRIEQPPAAPATPARPAMPADQSIPPAVMSLICGNCTERSLQWKAVSPGMEALSLHVPAGTPCGHRLRLLRLAPHVETPAHRHAGRELTLVLQGSFSDQTGEYHAGDLAIVHAPDFVHAPKAGPEGCLCLMLTEAPVRFHKIRIRILKLFWRA